MDNRQRIDDRADSFLQVGNVAKIVAEKHCRVEIDDSTHERWRQLMALLREFDTLVDDSNIADDEAIERLSSFSEFDERYPILSSESLGDATFNTLIARTRKILKLGKYIGQAATADRFVKLRIAEGIQTANFLDDSATDFVRNQENFKERFLPAIRSLSVTACLLDSITDARQDVALQKIAIQPDVDYFKRLALSSVYHSREGSRALVHPAVMKQFAIMSATRLKNRLANGRTDSSSLNIFHSSHLIE